MQRFFSFLFISSLLLCTACGHEETANEEAAFSLSVEEVVNAFLDDEAGSQFKIQRLNHRGKWSGHGTQ